MKILVTGAAGFIGFHLSQGLLDRGDEVIGVDIANDYYDPILKKKRLDILDSITGFSFHKQDLCDKPNFELLVRETKPDVIVHLAAQAGVRYSLENPLAYEEANNKATLVVFEVAQLCGISRVVAASSSSVYGGNTKTPFSETDDVSKPVSLYAATKRSNELVGHVYHHLYGLEVAMLRFFTVYGEYGRPDMAYFSFTKKILNGEEISVFNNGEMSRDFTYISDIVSGLIGAIDKQRLAYEIYNLGGDNPVSLMDFVRTIEKHCGVEAKIVFKEMQKGDVKVTMADVAKARAELGYSPKVTCDEGIGLFVKWYKENREWLDSLSDWK